MYEMILYIFYKSLRNDMPLIIKRSNDIGDKVANFYVKFEVTTRIKNKIFAYRFTRVSINRNHIYCGFSIQCDSVIVEDKKSSIQRVFSQSMFKASQRIFWINIAINPMRAQDFENIWKSVVVPNGCLQSIL